jgi:hypothetical protein
VTPDTFLLARVADEEREAIRDYNTGLSQYWLDRRLRTVDVRRRVVMRYRAAVNEGDQATADVLAWVIGVMADVYYDHPDFQSASATNVPGERTV